MREDALKPPDIAGELGATTEKLGSHSVKKSALAPGLVTSRTIDLSHLLWL